MPTGLPPILKRSFYNRDTVQVARDLLGTILVHGECVARIVEVEAYLDVDAMGRRDLAAHSSRGITARTRVIFGPPGHAYVYLIYGMYECLNIVAERDGKPGCVLIRALEPLAGIDVMHARRRSATGGTSRLCSGPGKLTRALGITREHSGADLTKGPVTVREPTHVQQLKIVAAKRVGITKCADWPLRFYLDGDPSVSQPARKNVHCPTVITSV